MPFPCRLTSDDLEGKFITANTICPPAQRCSGNVKHYLLSQSVTNASPLLSNLRKYSQQKQKSFRKREENLTFKCRDCWLDLAVSKKHKIPCKLVEAGFVLSCVF